MTPKRSTTAKKPTQRRVVFGSVAVVLTLLALWVINLKSPSVPDTDPLCKYVESQNFVCPALLGSSSVLRPGSIVQIREDADEEVKEVRVSIPTSQLDTACVFPGTTVVLPSPEPATPFPLPTFSYDLRRNIAAGAQFPIPEVQHLKVAAGPQGERVRKVEIEAGDSTFILLDENHLTALIADCRIKPSCVDRIKQYGDKVVNGVLVAGTLSYEFYDEEGRKLQVGAAIKEGIIKINGDLSNTSAAGTKLTADSGTVLGVTLIRDQVIADAQPCTQQVLYTLEGDAEVAIGGGGGRRNIGDTRNQARQLGNAASLSDQGSERSECSSGFERTRSRAVARAQLAPGEAPNSLLLEAAVSSRGGHYATAAQCIGSTLIGRTGHDTSAHSLASIRGRLNALVRREGPANLLATWSGLGDFVTLSVVSPTGESLLSGMRLGDSGEQRIEIPQGGMYGFSLQASLRSSANGARRGPTRNLNGSFTIELVE